MKKTFIPQEFKDKYSKIMGQEAQEFFKYCQTKQPKSLWINSLKINPNELYKTLSEKGWKLKELFHQNAFEITNVQKPGSSQEFQEGLFNLQEKASMLPALALNPKEKEKALDAAAAPGNKTLQLACLMNNKGQIIALDKNKQRMKSLLFNIKKFGIKNTKTITKDLLLTTKKDVFDKVLLDAPCSSEGLVRKDFKALKNWSQKLVLAKSKLQKKMIIRAFDLLKRNGILVYSTCSLSPEENEEVIDYLLKKRKCEIKPTKFKGIKTRKGLQEYENKKYSEEVTLCSKLYPQDNDTQAFFIAKIRKT
ncbi:MAG: RsmB/NOP family class I SAM-dependent RNA methyltransferase [Candidatus Diapherotrites archaeon]